MLRRGRLDGGRRLEVSEGFRGSLLGKLFRIRGDLNGLKGMVETSNGLPYRRGFQKGQNVAVPIEATKRVAVTRLCREITCQNLVTRVRVEYSRARSSLYWTLI